MAKIQLNVSFYDEKEKELFQNNYSEKVFGKLEKLTKETVRISFEDFRTYGILQHLNPSIGNLGTLQHLEKNRKQLLGVFDYYTHFDSENEKFTTKIGSINEQISVSETLGVAGALSFADVAFGTTPADWTKIMVSNHKDFDFRSAVTLKNKKLIVIEAKGSILEVNSKKETTISKHKSLIKRKKSDNNFVEKYKHGIDILIGIITIADTDHHLKQYLVDPPAESELNDEIRRNIKLFKRLQFYTYWINAIGSRSDLAKALINRLIALENLSNPFELQFSAFRKKNGEEMFWDDSMLNKFSHVNDIVGKVVLINNDLAFFFGLKTELFEYLMRQKFELINSYSAIPVTTHKNISCIIPNNRDTKSFIKENFETRKYFPESKNNVRFEARNVKITESSSGLCFGIIEKENLKSNRYYY